MTGEKPDAGPRPGAFGAAALARGGPYFCAWMFVPTPVVVETVARSGFSAVVLDAQHGFATFDSISDGVGAAALAGTPALVRLPLGGVGLGARALDMGAAGVIAPMIESAADARALVDATKFPPVGRRSWGPVRAAPLVGLDRDRYLAHANELTLTLAMIETARGLSAVKEIVETDGVDGLLIGPNDLSVSLSDGAAVDPAHPKVAGALETVLAAAQRAGKPVAIYANTPAFAADYAGRGFSMIMLGSDLGFLADGAARALADVFDAPAFGDAPGG